MVVGEIRPNSERDGRVGRDWGRGAQPRDSSVCEGRGEGTCWLVREESVVDGVDQEGLREGGRAR